LRRLHFFELFPIVNLVAIALIARTQAGVSILGMIVVITFALMPYAVIGMLVRAFIAAARKDRAYFAIIRDWRYHVETLRLVFATSLMINTYGWIKLTVPLVHPRLYDQQLWNLDRALFFGMSPNVFFLELFRAPSMLRAIDISYAAIFGVSIILALGYFFSHPSRRVRVAFANGNAAMWITGAWLYMLIPSVGPAYRFPDLWFPYAASLQKTQLLQAVLMKNYLNVHRWSQGVAIQEPIRIAYGIAAFPSLHVGFQTYVFLWLRRLWTWGEVLFGFFVVAIFLGSVVTGWHYAIDGLAAILLAWTCYALTSRASRMKRWFALFLSVHARTR
jgi:PAP2 superfamily protein